MLPTISSIENVNEFSIILQNNPGLIIIKLGAIWCRPCQNIGILVHEWFKKMPQNVQTIHLDIDENFEVYSLLKKKRMLRGIPAILMYKKLNNSFIPDDCVNNSDEKEINNFFTRCLKELELIV